MENERGTFDSKQFQHHLNFRYPVIGGSGTQRSMVPPPRDPHDNLGPNIDNNFMETNISAIKDLRPSKLSSCYQQIGLIHTQLMTEVEVTQNPTSMRDLESYLEPVLREQLKLGDPRKSDYVSKMNTLNNVFKEVLEMTCNYRIELGITLQRLVEGYSSVFLQLLKVSYENKKHRAIGNNEYEEKIREFDRKMLLFEDKKKEFREASEAQVKLLKSKDREIAIL